MNATTAPRCASCNASIRWVTMGKSGKTMPLDAVPVPDGNTIIELLDDGGERAWVFGKDAAPENVHRFRSHFSTCEFAAQHRKPNAKPEAK